ncbi:MAG: DUF4280 domain-containing protein [Holosporaceae bacterium]|nr:DUF4280 domain-containing protein [Holosporaceae bacterium]
MGACSGAIAKCSFGNIPTPLVFLPTSLLMGSAGPMGTCSDCIPFVNIFPFGLCSSILNPTTASLTAAASGVLTPGACIPTPAGIWIPTKPTVIGKTGPMLTNDSTLICAYGGVIKINMPAQFTVII